SSGTAGGNCSARRWMRSSWNVGLDVERRPPLTDGAEDDGGSGDFQLGGHGGVRGQAFDADPAGDGDEHEHGAVRRPEWSQRWIRPDRAAGGGDRIERQLRNRPHHGERRAAGGATDREPATDLYVVDLVEVALRKELGGAAA